MSMLATFVQVEPALFERIEDDPGLIEGLFAPSFGGMVEAAGMGAAILERGPRLLAGAIDMHPELRELIEERVGMTQAELSRGAGGEEVLRLMGEQAGPAPEQPNGVRRTLSLDKAWHGVHYLLTGSAESTDGPAGQAVLGGKEAGDDFSGYGPARLFEPPLVAELAAALADPAVEEAAIARFDPPRMAELQIYPFGWDELDDREWVVGSLRELRGFYAEAADQGLGVVTCLE
jgi:Domain of unknown function (DUF1877)